ncbi:MAG: aldose epimerase family protein [Phycisphaerae bacterium]
MASIPRGRFLVILGACCLCLASCQKQEEEPMEMKGERGMERFGVAETVYGKMPDGREVHLYTLTNSNGMRVKLTDYGATTVSVEVPDKEGKVGDVTLGYDSLEGWLGNTSYFGATVGRYANRIAGGTFDLGGKTYQLATNDGENHLHGGEKGFDKRLWDAEMVQTPDGAGVKFTRTSPDGEEGYPGTLQVTALYSLTKAGEFKAEFTATTDAPTVVNLAHHTYWNLRGPEKGDILGHELMLNADKYTPVDEGLIPTGELKPVEGTPFDFTESKPIGKDIGKVEGGYDHNFVASGYEPGKVRLAARVTEPTTGRVMEIHTDQPGIQFYSGNFLDGTITGKGGVAYEKHDGFCLETQHYPDSPNQPAFPSVTLKPGQTYKHVMIHKFSAE